MTTVAPPWFGPNTWLPLVIVDPFGRLTFHRMRTAKPKTTTLLASLITCEVSAGVACIAGFDQFEAAEAERVVRGNY